MSDIQQKTITGLKILVICILLGAITLVSVIQWKGDAIAQNAIHMLEKNLQDPLHYESVKLEWFRYFPCVALRIDSLLLGPADEPFIKSGHIDVVLSLCPLLKDNIIIHKLRISNATINLVKDNSRWSYEVFKSQDGPQGKNWTTLVHEIEIEKTRLNYEDHKDLSFFMEIENGNLSGILSDKVIDSKLHIQGSLLRLINTSYEAPGMISFTFNGNYKRDPRTGDQQFNDCNLKLDGIKIEGSGSTRKEKTGDYTEVAIDWKKGDVKSILQLLPNSVTNNLNEITLSGETDGHISIQGIDSPTQTLQTTCTVQLTNGLIQFSENSPPVKKVLLEMSYQNTDKQAKKKSFLKFNLRQGSFHNQPLRAEININDLDHPFLSLTLNGAVPAILMNAISLPENMHFENGIFEVSDLSIQNLNLENVSINSLIEKSRINGSMNDISLNYKNDKVNIGKGDLKLDPTGHLIFNTENLTWNKLTTEILKGQLDFASNAVGYKMQGKTCQGEIESNGRIISLGIRPVLESEWKMKGVEIEEVMLSFENFDQTFLTAENIKGKANVWAETTIPYDASGNILYPGIVASAAIDIKTGELKNMKTLEDFSSYIHLEDLRDIHFNEFRNYLRIENSKVYFPVVFLQSNAINLSVSGMHSFDQEILYHIKINAGQTVTNKLRKHDAGKNYKKARKSGWVNLYYVLSGSTSAVKYDQNQREVLAGFEGSSAIKESLRNHLVDRFGYDVYWLEPNEWEDIPEYE